MIKHFFDSNQSGYRKLYFLRQDKIKCLKTFFHRTDGKPERQNDERNDKFNRCIFQFVILKVTVLGRASSAIFCSTIR